MIQRFPLIFLLISTSLVDAFYVKPHGPSASSTQLGIFGGGGGTIPSSPADRDNQAVSAVKAAIGKPKTRGFPLIECEFPPLAAQNKMGDGSLRSANEIDQANLAFCVKLVKAIAPLPMMGPKTWVLISGGATKAFTGKAEAALKSTGATLASLRGGIPGGIGNGDVVIFLTPSGRGDYNMAKTMAQNGLAKSVVIVNGLAKDQDSVSGKATMAYYLKPLTYNSQIAGYLVRSYPGDWTVFDAATKKPLGSFSDSQILFGESNTPDLRESVKMVQLSFDQRAIAARKG